MKTLILIIAFCSIAFCAPDVRVAGLKYSVSLDLTDSVRNTNGTLSSNGTDSTIIIPLTALDGTNSVLNPILVYTVSRTAGSGGPELKFRLSYCFHGNDLCSDYGSIDTAGANYKVDSSFTANNAVSAAGTVYFKILNVAPGASYIKLRAIKTSNSATSSTTVIYSFKKLLGI